MSDWEPSGLGKTIFTDRYARSEEETWQEACRRVADHVASAEHNGKFRKYADRFYDQLVSNKFNPGGRIWYGCGRPMAQLLNCFVLPTTDSAEGWGQTLKEVIVVSSSMGGIGINVSPIRGRGTPLKRKGGVATGAVSLMQMINGAGDVLVGGGGRRMALMLCLDINHPDLEEFLNVKLDLNQLNNANVSVVLPSDISTEDFQRMVENGEEIEVKFNGMPTGKTINAKTLWNKLVENAWKSGEPGFLNGYVANKMNNIAYYAPLISTNPCGEIWLEAYGCCDLGALVLPRFVSNGKFNWDEFDESIRLGVRFLDDVLTVNHYPLPEIEENCQKTRRIGLGVMGLHSMLLELGLKYSSKEAHEFVDKLFSFIKNTSYDESTILAVEKGPFPAYKPEFLDGGFAKTLKRGLRNKIKEHGIRNCALLTIAPTGTTSMVSDVSSGIEPLPAPVYWRTYLKATADGRKEKHRDLVVRKEYHDFPDIIEGAADLTPRSHFEMQKIVQSHIDNAVSKTINLPTDYPMEELADIWLEYLPHMKGSTFYRWGTREDEPIKPVKIEDAQAVIAENQANVVYDFDVDTQAMLDLACVGGVCDVPVKWAEEAASIS